MPEPSAPPYVVRIDPPPSYNAAITIYPETCEPPPYINVVIQNSSNPPTPTTGNQAHSRSNPPNMSNDQMHQMTQVPPYAEQLPILHHLETVQKGASSSDG